MDFAQIIIFTGNTNSIVKTISDFLKFTTENYAASRKPLEQWVFGQKICLNLLESLAIWVSNPLYIMKNSEKIM